MYYIDVLKIFFNEVKLNPLKAIYYDKLFKFNRHLKSAEKKL